ncbi:MAG: alpha-ketoglutarate-dependent dioxygenase AlkB [Deltaproteobacteria bacterium]|nr:alpha-ketoglutarate-dependent dioxygenase AlkB [Deltaproteobacteria bacterium]
MFARGAPSFDAAFTTARRADLGDGAWIDHTRGWVRNHDALFDQLEQALPWRTETMTIYDRTVVVPRLLARVPDELEPIAAMRRALSAHYGEPFVFTSAALYRDGRDSVAMHGDTTARDMDRALVATISLGAARTLQVRPAAGGPSRPYPLHGGDLVVMGGTCQRTFRHGIPKVAHAGPRIAVMFRPAWAANYRTSVARER